MKCLMLGAGSREPKPHVYETPEPDGREREWTTLDFMDCHNPDIKFDLRHLNVGGQIPADKESFDEIHAYEVLEHFGQQGDFQAFFNAFREFWRLLKPGGLFIASVPSLKSEWLWADPGHTRSISVGTIVFLEQEHYNKSNETSSSDYREYVHPFWWSRVGDADDGSHFFFILRKEVC